MVQRHKCLIRILAVMGNRSFKIIMEAMMEIMEVVLVEVAALEHTMMLAVLVDSMEQGSTAATTWVDYPSRL